MTETQESHHQNRSVTCMIWRALAAAGAAASLTAGLAAAAGAHTCGSNWCSGSDSNTGTNIQGNAPQIYIGEVDTYCDDFYGPAHGCSYNPAWNNTGAYNAWYREMAGTGMGAQAYYFGGGAGANNQGVDSYCWGAKQGFDAAWRMANTFNNYRPWQYLMFIDVEPGDSTLYGWYSTEQSANRQVFNGFADYMAGASTCAGTNSQDLSQYGAYSSPDAWHYAMGSYGSIPNTYAWTYEQCCAYAWPGSDWGGKFQDFGGSNYRWALQYDNSSLYGQPDLDDSYEPDYLPVFGVSVGN